MKQEPSLPELPPFPQTITMLSDLQSGTMEVVHEDTALEWGLACYRAGIEKAATKLEPSMSELMLMAGEMTAGEKRTVKAILAGLAAAIRSLKP